MEQIFNYSNKIISNVNTGFYRYLYSKINWGVRLIEITGARGVGKTTLMLQKAKELNRVKPNQAVYVSMDDKLMYTNSIVDIAEELEKYGVKYLFIDEVHKYPPKLKGYDWSAEIKTIYDRNPGLNLIYSGSSVLRIYKGQGDLSRRKSSYRLTGLSFREYLKLNGVLSFENLRLEEIVKEHMEIAVQIVSKIKIIPHFKKYLRYGYYPFYSEDPENYFQRLLAIINVIIETDIPAVSEIPFETAVKLKRLLSAIAGSVPYVPNLTRLRQDLYITDHRTLLKYLDFLEKAEVLNTLMQEAKGNKILQKPDKIYLSNTNISHALTFSGEDKGAMRETFFNSQVGADHRLRLPDNCDFMVDNHYYFEIGGKNKHTKQIKDLPNAYVVADDLETGIFRQIPLWLFGFLY